MLSSCDDMLHNDLGDTTARDVFDEFM